MSFGEPAPLELSEWNLAERFGWTLEYIRSLPISDIWTLNQVDDGRNKAKTSPYKRGKHG